MPENKTRVEEITVSSDKLLKKLKDLIREGNIRRITVKNMEDKTLLEIPLTLGVVGAVLLPVWAAIAALLALAAKFKIVIERIVE